MIEMRGRQLLIDGQPRLVMSGEVHYFRLRREEWADRIGKLKTAGCNCVASYIPWLMHELEAGVFDLEGRTRPELDLGGFIDLCRDEGLWFLVRPGPFIMAEMKNEGLPYRLYEEHPEIVPVSWDGKPVPTRTVDYLAPAFLAESRRWYEAVMRVIAPRLQPRGGNVIAVQLDNEIGMLSWVTNSPDLTEHVLADFAIWLGVRYDSDELQRRYPFNWNDGQARAIGVRSPREEYAARLTRDLGWYMRDRFARYVAALREFAEEFEIEGVPFVVNIHGTSDGGGATYPIGISQLFEAYTRESGYLPGSDVYLGDLTLWNLPDLYLINAFMTAVQRPEQPLSSVEFEAGDGDYGRDGSRRVDPSAADFKLRMCVAQGNRLINHYLFSGGVNVQLPRAVGDGDDRVAFTGERHGVAAPIDPEGRPNPLYPYLARSIGALMAVGEKLAEMREEWDPVAFGFIPDYFMTESVYPESESMKQMVENLAANRFGGPRKVLARAMLLTGFRFGAVDLQNRALEPERTPVLALTAARYMDRAVQAKLVEYLAQGGRLFLMGEVPLFDMEGEPCTVLADSLGLRWVADRRGTPSYFPSAVADDWAAPREEWRVNALQTFEPSYGRVILRVRGEDEACGFEIGVGKGTAIVVTADVPCDVEFFRAGFERLGVRPQLAHNCAAGGIFLTSTASPGGERFLHLLNLDGFEKRVRPTEDGQDLLGGREVVLGSKVGLMLPINVDVGIGVIRWSTAEIAAIEPHAVRFRRTQPREVLAISTDSPIVVGERLEMERQGETLLVTHTSPAGSDADEFTVRLE